MSLRIGRWNCSYRVMESQPQALRAADTLEQRVRRSVLDAYEATLDTVFANDPAVYVVRRLDVKLTMHIAEEPNARALARRWGEQIGAHAVRAILAKPNSANVVRFENQADFVAHFLRDMLSGFAWQHWYYGAFTRFRRSPERECVLTILREYPHLLAAIFNRLARLGSLRAVLDLLDEEAVSVLWSEMAPLAERESTVAEVRVFVQAALRIADALGLWTSGPIDEAVLLETYVATHPQHPDWTDRRSLAAAVCGVLRFAEQRGRIRIARGAYVQEQRGIHAAELAASLDWLDLDWLGDILAGSPLEAVARPVLRQSVKSAVTPNQRKLLVRLSQLLGAAAIPLDHAHPASESNALRIYAALAATDPDLAAHPATISMVKLLVAAWQAIDRIKDPITALQQLQAGRVPGAAAHDIPQEQAQALRSAAALGPLAADIIHELMAHAPIALRTPAESVTETAFAGLFLLVRAITESRLTPPVSLLFALGLQWSAAPQSEQALYVWCGLTKPEPAAAILDRLDPVFCETLLARVKSTLESRASIDSGLIPITDVPADWVATLTETWPSGVSRPASITMLAVHLLRLWARWLRGFSRASVPYLLQQFVRRPGRIEMRTDEIVVTLRPAPLDPVLEMSGYLASTPPVPWLFDRRVSFRIDRRYA
jgi:hypothetical protein